MAWRVGFSASSPIMFPYLDKQLPTPDDKATIDKGFLRVEKGVHQGTTPGKLSSRKASGIRRQGDRKSGNPPPTTQPQELPDNYRTACG